jgi:hypothetical protein
MKKVAFLLLIFMSLDKAHAQVTPGNVGTANYLPNPQKKTRPILINFLMWPERLHKVQELILNQH